VCMIDYSDENLTLLADKTPAATKSYRCDECGRLIAKGERYRYEAGMVGRRFEVYRTCVHCTEARKWLASQCGGWVYGGVYDDLLTHWHDGHREGGLGRLIVGMRRQWASFGGGLLPAAKGGTPDA